MRNRLTCRATLALSIAVLLSTKPVSVVAGESEQNVRPNILFIMTDQQHAGMMSCTGNSQLKTPALDRLATAGIRFECAYATNPVCVPSRFSLQTGHLPSAVGMRANNTRVDVPEDMSSRSVGPLLRGAGYRCAYGGKVHLPSELSNYIFEHGYENISKDARDGLATSCAAFIKQEHDKPFFLFASFINPHDICYMAINDFARQQGKSVVRNLDSQICEQILDVVRQRPDSEVFVRDQCPPLPTNFQPPRNEPECIRLHYVQARPFRTYAREQWSEDTWRLHRWLYARLTERVDAQIGQILDALADAGLEEETLVIFTSDHGDMNGAHRLEHKSVLYEEAVRVPFLMTWKGHIPADTVDRTHLVSNGLDLLPTICDFAGVARPPALPGRSLRSLTTGRSVSGWRDYVVVESQNGRMVRTTRYKYCLYDCGENREMLVDLKDDPGEMNNLAADAEYRDVLNDHRRLLETWTSQRDDQIGRMYLAHPD